MERQIRRLALGFLVLFAALAVNLNYLQVIAADDLAGNNANKRLILDEYEVDRGLILSSDPRIALADTRRTGGDLKYQRIYEQAPEHGYGHITGYHSFVFGRTELELTFNDELSARSDDVFTQRLIDEFLGRDLEGATIVTTIVPELQELAANALADRDFEGAVAAIDPRTGDVLALVSRPTYDPSPLASHDPERVRRAYQSLEPEEPDSPLVSRATDTFFPPGSSFKIVTAAAALEAGLGADHLLPNPPAYDVPQTTDDLENFGGGTCPGGSQIDMATALQISCNVYFAQLAVELGPEALVDQAQRFGFSEDIEFDIPFVEGEIPDVSGFEDDIPALAQSGIGQRDVRTNVLHMALVAGAIGNHGLMMQPRLVTEVRDPQGRPLRHFDPAEYGEPLSELNAGILTEMMVSVVQSGTGTAAQVPGIAVAGKTGTAQTAEGEAPHAWFVAFAPADDPEIAVAVMILNGGDLGREATGGQLSAPIAKTLIEARLGG